ncbi:MAG: glycosyltransferase, partial [bacterium]|nr:glycosyltransferase [bacterium]
MRVLMIHNRYGATARGGAERVVERLEATLRERGHVVDVYHRTTLGFGALDRLPAFVRALWHIADSCNVIAAFRLRATLQRTKPDIIHTHNLIGCGGLTPWIIRRSGIPWIHTLHDVQLITPSGLLTAVSPPLLEGEREVVYEQKRGGSDSSPEALAKGERGWGGLASHTALERSVFGRWFRAFRRRLLGSPDVVTSPSQWLLKLHRGERFFPRSLDAVVGNPIDAQPTAPPRHGAVRTFLFA